MQRSGYPNQKRPISQLALFQRLPAAVNKRILRGSVTLLWLSGVVKLSTRQVENALLYGCGVRSEVSFDRMCSRALPRIHRSGGSRLLLLLNALDLLKLQKLAQRCNLAR